MLIPHTPTESWTQLLFGLDGPTRGPPCWTNYNTPRPCNTARVVRYNGLHSAVLLQRSMDSSNSHLTRPGLYNNHSNPAMINHTLSYKHISYATIHIASGHFCFVSLWCTWCLLCVMVAALSVVLLMWSLILKSQCCMSTLGLKASIMHLIWLYLCVGFWSQCEPDYFHMWLWRPNCNISKIQFLSLNMPVLQTETLKWYWNDTCNRSLRLCAWLRSLEKHLPAVSLSCCVFLFFILFDLVNVMLRSSQSWWRDEHYCR